MEEKRKDGKEKNVFFTGDIMEVNRKGEIKNRGKYQPFIALESKNNSP